MLESWQEETEGPKFMIRELTRTRYLETLFCKFKGWMPADEVVGDMVQWYAEQWRHFATPRWEWWEMDWVAVRAHLGAAHHAAAELCESRRQLALRQQEVARFPTIELWISALHRGEINSAGPFERHATELLDRPARRRYWEVRVQADHARPRRCVRCGMEFRGAHRRIVRCPECRAVAKATKP